MRIALILFISSIFLYACNSNCACKSGAENVTIIEGLYGDFASGNIEGVVAALSPDVEWNEAENYIYADKNPYIGPDAVLQGLFARIGSEWTYFNVVEPDVKPVGAEHVLATGRYQGELKSNGQVVDAQFAHVWGLRDGKVVTFQQYTDTKQMADAIVVTAEAPEESDE